MTVYVLSSDELSDRAHVAADVDSSITCCGERISGPCSAISMLVCLRCRAVVLQTELAIIEKRLSRGDY